MQPPVLLYTQHPDREAVLEDDQFSKSPIIYLDSYITNMVYYGYDDTIRCTGRSNTKTHPRFAQGAAPPGGRAGRPAADQPARHLQAAASAARSGACAGAPGCAAALV